MRTRVFLLAAGAVASLNLAGCASNTKGSWSCRAQAGSPCATISQIDQDEPVTGKRHHKHQPVIDGAGAARWWDQKDGYAQAPAGGPRREGDQVMRIVVAPWVDAIGDYHARSEIFAVMRKGAWWSSPSSTPLPPAPPPKTASLDPEHTRPEQASSVAKPSVE